MNPDTTLKLPVTIGKGTNEVTIYRIGMNINILMLILSIYTFFLTNMFDD